MPLACTVPLYLPILSSVSLFTRPNKLTVQSPHIRIYLYTFIFIYLLIYEAVLA